MVKGRVEKTVRQMCLLEAPWIKGVERTVADVIAETTAKLGEKISVRRFKRRVHRWPPRLLQLCPCLVPRIMSGLLPTACVQGASAGTCLACGGPHGHIALPQCPAAELYGIGCLSLQKAPLSYALSLL